jgi:hypothetical protein
MHVAVVKGDTRAGDEVLYGRGDQDLDRPGQRGDGAPMTTAIPAMSSRRGCTSRVWIPTRTSVPSRWAASRIAQPHWIARAGPSKVARKPAPVGVDLTAAKAFELSAHHRIVTVEQIAPAALTNFDHALGGSDDVGEQHRSEHAIGFGTRAQAGEELVGAGNACRCAMSTVGCSLSSVRAPNARTEQHHSQLSTPRQKGTSAISVRNVVRECRRCRSTTTQPGLMGQH